MMKCSAAQHCGETPHLPVQSVQKIEPGARVRITCGPLKGLQGVITGELDGGWVAVVCIRLVQGVLIGIDPTQVEAIGAADRGGAGRRL
jgi:hypothetical protein